MHILYGFQDIDQNAFIDLTLDLELDNTTQYIKFYKISSLNFSTKNKDFVSDFLDTYYSNNYDTYLTSTSVSNYNQLKKHIPSFSKFRRNLELKPGMLSREGEYSINLIKDKINNPRLLNNLQSKIRTREYEFTSLVMLSNTLTNAIKLYNQSIYQQVQLGKLKGKPFINSPTINIREGLYS